MWGWRRLKRMKWPDGVSKAEVLKKVEDGRILFETLNRKKGNCIVRIIILTSILEGMWMKERKKTEDRYIVDRGLQRTG